MAFNRTCFVFIALLLAISNAALAQYKVKGTVYDSSRLYAIEAVTVMATNGRATATDTAGRYTIDVSERDSIWFSFLGKPTAKYAVAKIADITQFDIALRLKSNILKEVRIKTRSYREDSLQNRRDYAKAFNFRRPSLGTMTSTNSNGFGVGFDIQEIIRLFQFRKNRSMERFRERLEQEERDKAVDHRYTKGLVKRLTGIETEEELLDFMRRNRPTYEFTIGTSDYEFQSFIKITYAGYKKVKAA